MPGDIGVSILGSILPPIPRVIPVSTGVPVEASRGTPAGPSAWDDPTCSSNRACPFFTSPPSWVVRVGGPTRSTSSAMDTFPLDV